MKRRGKVILIVVGAAVVLFVIVTINYFSKAMKPLELLTLQRPYEEEEDYPELVKTLGSKWSPGISRQYAAEALAHIEDPEVAKTVVEPLIQMVKSKKYDAFARGRAALALGCIGDERAIEPLIEALNDNDNETRLDVIKAFTLFEDVRDERISRAILEILDDMNSDERSFAISGFNVDNPEVIKVLVDLVKNDSKARHNAILSLGNTKTKDEETFQVLLDILDGNYLEGLSSSRKGLVMSEAILSLGKIGDNRAVEPLLKILEEDPIRYLEAAIALGELGDKRAIEHLKVRMEEKKNKAYIMKDLNAAYRKLTGE